MKMKNKNTEQKIKKQSHLKRKQHNTRIQPTLERNEEPTRLVKERLLIVCEGENTEPSYFKQFRLTSATIKTVGEGYNTISLVERAIALSERDEYDQIWCVFDKDDFSNEDFNAAIQKVENLENFRVAYSNQAFEYWIILHFEDHQGGGMHRSLYYDKINEYLKEFGLNYDKDSKIIDDKIFDILIGLNEKSNKSRQELAISRATRIYDNLDHYSPAEEASSTTVFMLVEEIMKYK